MLFFIPPSAEPLSIPCARAWITPDDASPGPETLRCRICRRRIEALRSVHLPEKTRILDDSHCYALLAGTQASIISPFDKGTDEPFFSFLDRRDVQAVVLGSKLVLHDHRYRDDPNSLAFFRGEQTGTFRLHHFHELGLRIYVRKDVPHDVPDGADPE
jgi:hypothetical protein